MENKTKLFEMYKDTIEIKNIFWNLFEYGFSHNCLRFFKDFCTLLI